MDCPERAKDPDGSKERQRVRVGRRQFGNIVGCIVAASAVPLLSTHSLEAGDSSRSLPPDLKDSQASLNKLAISEYETNMRAFGGRLATPARYLRKESGDPVDYDVVIVGSGYGASVCAARLSAKLKKSKSLCVLERGEEWVPGSFEKSGPRPYRIKRNSDLAIIESSALGGASVFDFGDAARPDPRALDSEAWPETLRDRSYLESYLDLAELELGMRPWLGPTGNPNDHLQLASRRLAAKGSSREIPRLAIAQGRVESRIPILNRQGLLQRPCNGCGECWSGCNIGAKNTLAVNYLAMARKSGAELFTRSDVHSIEKLDKHYRVHLTQTFIDATGTLSVQPACVTCRVVILAAGSLGSTSILLRSQNAHFRFSDSLGQNWSTNGDTLGILGPAGFGTVDNEEPSGKGPIIQANLTYPEKRDYQESVTIQGGNLAKSLRPLLSELGSPTSGSQLLFCMGHNPGKGSVELDRQGEPQVVWNGNPLYHRIAGAELARVAEASGHRLLHTQGFVNPVFHAIGGCCFGDSSSLGVVSHKGQVFDGLRSGTHRSMTEKTHDGLYVCDGSTLPSSLACNPSLTIAALAERTSQLLLLEPKYADLFDL